MRLSFAWCLTENRMAAENQKSTLIVLGLSRLRHLKSDFIAGVSLAALTVPDSSPPAGDRTEMAAHVVNVIRYLDQKSICSTPSSTSESAPLWKTV